MSNPVWTIEALPQGDEIKKDGKAADHDEVLRILNSQNRSVAHLQKSNQVLSQALEEAIDDFSAIKEGLEISGQGDEGIMSVCQILDERVRELQDSLNQANSD